VNTTILQFSAVVTVDKNMSQRVFYSPLTSLNFLSLPLNSRVKVDLSRYETENSVVLTASEFAGWVTVESEGKRKKKSKKKKYLMFFFQDVWHCKIICFCLRMFQLW
jgi:hypothetical protein